MGGFNEQVIAYVKQVPKGKVVSYGQVAAACGNPRAAREVGWALRSIDSSDISIPWWRVVNREGVISIKGNWEADKNLQKQLLQKEGIAVDENFTVDMQKYQYKN